MKIIKNRWGISITNDQIKGLNISIKSIFKKYFFFHDWNVTSDWDEFPTQIKVELYVDVNQLSQYFEKQVNKNFIEELNSNEKISCEFLLYPLYYNSDVLPKKSKPIQREITNLINTIYSSLPSDMRINWRIPNTIQEFHNLIHITKYNFVI